ncbi:MAG: hypothetical protein M0R74_12070 [Dehalococcoidia bacterium]|nr:hypothetical protein [Dehalococcoidia bacterium]
MANIRSDLDGQAVRAPEPLLTWCWHPVEELQLVYAGGRRPIPGRRLCGLCGELVFLTR